MVEDRKRRAVRSAAAKRSMKCPDRRRQSGENLRQAKEKNPEEFERKRIEGMRRFFARGNKIRPPNILDYTPESWERKNKNLRGEHWKAGQDRRWANVRGGEVPYGMWHIYKFYIKRKHLKAAEAYQAVIEMFKKENGG